MHKKIQLNRLVLILLVIFIVTVSFLAGYLYALKVVGDDKQAEFDAIQRRTNKSN